MTGWDGLRFLSGGTGTLTNTIVTGTNTPHGAVRAEGGASVTLDGAIVEGNASGPGVVASGGYLREGSPPRPGRAILTGFTRIFDHATAVGVLAENGGFVEIAHDSVQVYDNALGVEARTGGARVLMTAGTIRDNDGGPGVRAGAGGTVDLWSGYSDGGSGGSSDANGSASEPIKVLNNIGGLYAEATAGGFSNSSSGGGVITTALNVLCVKEPCPSSNIGQNSFVDNNGTTTDTRFDILAQPGSLVDAAQNYWGTDDASEVEFPASDAPRISYLPILTTDPSGAGSAARSGGASGGATGFDGDDPDFTGVALAVATADRLRLGNGPAEAAAALIAAYHAAGTDGERALVAAGAARLLGDVPEGALTRWAQRAAGLPGADRPWARRALAEAWMTKGRTGDAATTAQALADEDGAAWTESETAAGHRIAGLTVVVRAAIQDLDRGAAEQALASLAEVDAEEAAVLAVMAAATLGEIDLGGSAKHAASADGAPVLSAGLTVWPNPTAGVLTVRIAETTGTVEVALFDALGRRVATLHDGDAAGALVLPFDGAALAPGVYVVRVRTTDSVSARSVTVAR